MGGNCKKRKKKEKRNRKKRKTAHLLIDGFIAVPSCHCLQHAAQKTAITPGLVLCTACHRVDDIREHLKEG